MSGVSRISMRSRLRRCSDFLLIAEACFVGKSIVDQTKSEKARLVWRRSSLPSPEKVMVCHGEKAWSFRAAVGEK